MTQLEQVTRVLTYMSIRVQINQLLADEKLFRLELTNAKDPRRRTVLMSREINAMVVGPWADDPMGERCALLRADLEAFISNQFITVCWDPYKARDEQIGRLNGDEVWDLRSQKPPPGLRVFCRFAEKDVLVATNCSPRSTKVSWLNRLPLLDRESVQWKTAIAECQAEWSLLFPQHNPHSGNSAHDYISNAIL